MDTNTSPTIAPFKLKSTNLATILDNSYTAIFSWMSLTHVNILYGDYVTLVGSGKVRIGGQAFNNN